MELTPSVVERHAAEYRDREPLYPVERDAIETMPAALSAGEFGRRDAQWVVRWHYRRFLGEYPDGDRRAAEGQFRENAFEDVLAAIADAAAADGAGEAVEALATLEGVDVPVGSAFLFFLDPDAYLVVGRREWTVLRAAGELERPYPDPPDVDDYLEYLRACRSVADRLDCGLVTLHRALWRLWDAELAEEG